MNRFRERIGYVVIAAWATWVVVSVGMLLAYRADGAFVALYFLYLLLCGIVLRSARHDLLSPPGLITISGFMTFGLSFPLIYVGERHLLTSDLTSVVLSDDAMVRALVIFLVAKAAFLSGCYSFIYRYIWLPWRVPHQQSRTVSMPLFLVFVALVIGAGAVRINFHLGEAGRLPTIPFAGYLQYTLFDGVFLACIWFLVQSLRQSRPYVILGLSLLLLIAITQALLGWKGGIIQMIYVAIGVFWYQVQYQQRRRPYSLLWLLTLVVMAGTLIQFGAEVRAARLGGESVFAKSFIDLIEKIAFRSQGVTRLATITEHFGPVTWVNNFFIVDLYSRGLTTTLYIDRLLYAVIARQAHSVGTSGPGGPYVAMGLTGVMTAYFLLGVFYRRVYVGVTTISSRENNVLFIVLYAYLMFTLAGLLSENFNIAFIKNMIAVFFFLFILRFAVTKIKLQR